MEATEDPKDMVPEEGERAKRVEIETIEVEPKERREEGKEETEETEAPEGTEEERKEKNENEYGREQPDPMSLAYTFTFFNKKPVPINKNSSIHCIAELLRDTYFGRFILSDDLTRFMLKTGIKGPTFLIEVLRMAFKQTGYDLVKKDRAIFALRRTIETIFDPADILDMEVLYGLIIDRVKHEIETKYKELIERVPEEQATKDVFIKNYMQDTSRLMLKKCCDRCDNPITDIGPFDVIPIHIKSWKEVREFHVNLSSVSLLKGTVRGIIRPDTRGSLHLVFDDASQNEEISKLNKTLTIRMRHDLKGWAAFDDNIDRNFITLGSPSEQFIDFVQLEVVPIDKLNVIITMGPSAFPGTYGPFLFVISTDNNSDDLRKEISRKFIDFYDGGWKTLTLYLVTEVFSHKTMEYNSLKPMKDNVDIAQSMRRNADSYPLRPKFVRFQVTLGKPDSVHMDNLPIHKNISAQIAEEELKSTTDFLHLLEKFTGANKGLALSCAGRQHSSMYCNKFFKIPNMIIFKIDYSNYTGPKNIRMLEHRIDLLSHIAHDNKSPLPQDQSSMYFDLHTIVSELRNEEDEFRIYKFLGKHWVCFDGDSQYVVRQKEVMQCPYLLLYEKRDENIERKLPAHLEDEEDDDRNPSFHPNGQVWPTGAGRLKARIIAVGGRSTRSVVSKIRKIIQVASCTSLPP